MATYDFRILLENIDGGKTSYISSSFVDTSVDLVLSASQVFARITGSVSCSYQNTSFFSQSVEPTTADINTSFIFKDNNLLSATLTGSLDTGAIEFTSLNTEYDRLLRYKFYGEKVCSTLGLPNNQWVYVDQMRLAADDEANYFEGNINAKTAYISNNLSFSNQSTINSDVPFLIDTGSDRHIKFIDTSNIPTTTLFMGYDKDTNNYEIGGSSVHLNGIETISGSTKLLNMKFGNSTGLTMLGNDTGDMEILMKRSVGTDQLLIKVDDAVSKIQGSDDVQIGSTGFLKAVYIDKSENRVGIGDDDPLATLHVFGDLRVDGKLDFGVDTFADGGTTPSVENGTVFKTNNSTSTDITTFTDGSAGQIIHVIIQDNNTDFTNGTNLKLFRGADFDTLQTDDVISFVCLDGTVWLQLNSQDNSS